MKSHTRVLAILVAFAIAAVVIVLVVSQKSSPDAPRDPVAVAPTPTTIANDPETVGTNPITIADAPETAAADRVAVADYLPGGILGFISVYDAPLARILWETGMADAIASDYTESIEKRVKALREHAGRVRSLHLAMKEFRPGLEPAPFLLVAETGLPDAVAALPEIIREDLIPDGTAHEIEIFCVRMDELSEAAPRRQAPFHPESLLFVAGHDGLLWIGNDRRFLEESISLMVGDAPASLAGNETYQSLSANALVGRANMFVSVPGIIRMMEFNMSRRELERFRTFFEITRLKLIEVGSVVIGGDHLTVRLKVDDRERFAAIRPPAAGPAVLADFVSDESLLFIDYRFDDARQVIEEVKNYYFDITLAEGQVRRRREFDEGIRNIEENMGFRFDEVAELIANEFAQSVGEGHIAALVEVKDAGRANQLILRLQEGQEIITRMVDDIEYYTTGDRMFDYCWAMVDNVVIISHSDEGIRSAIMARSRDLTLARSDHYRKLAERLPAVNSVHMYADIFGYINFIGEFTNGRHLDDMPAELRRWLEGLELAAAINIDDDVIEIKLVSSNRITEAVVVSFIEARVENITAQDEILKQILARPIRVIDVETLELLEVTVGDYEINFERDPATGFKIDHRGRRIAVPITCATCREPVPPAAIPQDVGEDEYENLLKNYRCPRCGERVYGM